MNSPEEWNGVGYVIEILNVAVDSGDGISIGKWELWLLCGCGLEYSCGWECLVDTDIVGLEK